MELFLGEESSSSILKLISTREEAGIFMDGYITMSEIMTTTRGLMSSLKHAKFLEILYINASKSQNSYDLSLASLLFHAITNFNSCINSMVISINTLVDEIGAIEPILRKYGEEHYRLSIQLEGDAAIRNSTLSQYETELCEKLLLVERFSCVKASSNDYEQLMRKLSSRSSTMTSTFISRNEKRKMEDSCQQSPYKKNKDEFYGSGDFQCTETTTCNTSSDSLRENVIDESTTSPCLQQSEPSPNGNVSKNTNANANANANANEKKRRVPLSDISPCNSQQSSQNDNDEEERNFSSLLCNPSSNTSVSSGAASSQEVDISFTA
jgi:hypothetical protein